MAEISPDNVVKREVRTGDLTITSPGAELRNLDVFGRIIVKAPDVIIHNCRVRGARKGSPMFPSMPAQYRPLIDMRHAAASGTITSCHLEPDDATANWESGVSGTDFKLYDSVITRTVDAVRINSGSTGKRSANVEIQNNTLGYLAYFRAVAPGIVHPSDVETHNDIVQIEGTDGARILNNEMYGYWSVNWGDEGVWKPSLKTSDFNGVQFNNRGIKDPVSGVILTGNTIYGCKVPVNVGGAPRLVTGQRILTAYRNIFAGDPGLDGVTILADRTWQGDNGLDCGERTSNANHLYSLLGPEIVVKRNG